MRAGTALVGALAVAALAVGSGPEEPPPRIRDAEPWMLEALPGIGVKTRDELLREFRERGHAVLPPSARALGRRCLGFEPGADAGREGAPGRE